MRRQSWLQSIRLGDAWGNYDEFRFFTGLRPSERVAILVSADPPQKGKFVINRSAHIAVMVTERWQARQMGDME
jgi:hypothetical protein